VLFRECWEIIQPNSGRTMIHLEKGANEKLLLILKINKDLREQVAQFPSTAFNVKA
jgi:hypothetical protein